MATCILASVGWIMTADTFFGVTCVDCKERLYIWQENAGFKISSIMFNEVRQ